MVVQVEAYRCEHCGVLIEGNRSKAEEHERMPVSKIIPIGFVCRQFVPDNDSIYAVYAIITSRGRLCWDHKYSHQVRVLTNNEETNHLKVFGGDEDGAWINDAEKIRNDVLSHLSNAELEEFRTIYDLAENEHVRWQVGLTSKDLTNKL